MSKASRGPSCVSKKRRPKGWTPERRALQAAVARRDKPWRHSTGPRTEAGKARCATNAMRHGGRSRAHVLQMQRIRRVLRMCAENIRILRAFIRVRDGLAAQARDHSKVALLAAVRETRLNSVSTEPVHDSPSPHASSHPRRQGQQQGRLGRVVLRPRLRVLGDPAFASPARRSHLEWRCGSHVPDARRLGRLDVDHLGDELARHAPRGRARPVVRADGRGPRAVGGDLRGVRRARPRVRGGLCRDPERAHPLHGVRAAPRPPQRVRELHPDRALAGVRLDLLDRGRARRRRGALDVVDHRSRHRFLRAVGALLGSRIGQLEHCRLVGRCRPYRRALRTVRHHRAWRIRDHDRRHLRRIAMGPVQRGGLRRIVHRHGRDVVGLFRDHGGRSERAVRAPGRPRRARACGLHLRAYPDHRRHHLDRGRRRIGACPSGRPSGDERRDDSRRRTGDLPFGQWSLPLDDLRRYAGVARHRVRPDRDRGRDVLGGPARRAERGHLARALLRRCVGSGPPPARVIASRQERTNRASARSDRHSARGRRARSSRT